MMKGKTPLLIAVVLGILAGAIAWQGIKRKEKEVKAGWNLVPVIVASQDIAEGTTVTYDMLSQRPVPEQFVTTSIVKPDSANYVIGQKVLVPLQAGDLLTWSQFESSKGSERISTVVQRQLRAFTLDVSGSRMSVGGWVRPNDHVDIIGSFRNPQTGDQLAVTLMQNVLVAATGRITGTTNVNLVPESDRDYQTITFMLLPEEAELLSLASDMGSLSLSLRNPEDIEMRSTHEHSTIATLLTGVRVRELEGIRQNLVTVVRGNQVTQERTGQH